MPEIRRLTPSPGPCDERTVRRSPDARTRRDTVVMEWQRVRTIVDALLPRAPGTTDHHTGGAIPTGAVVGRDRTPAGQE